MKRRKLGPTRLQRERTRARKAATRDPRVIRGRDVRATFLIDGEEVEFAGAAFAGIDRSVEPQRLSGSVSAQFTAVDDGGPLHFTTDHESTWEALWRSVNRGMLGVPISREFVEYPTEPADDRVDALAYAWQASAAARGVEDVPPRHLMTRLIDGLTRPLDRAEVVRRIRDEFADDPAMRDTLLRSISEPPVVNVQRIEVHGGDPDRFVADMVRALAPPRSLFSRCARLRSELNDLLTTPDGFSIA